MEQYFTIDHLFWIGLAGAAAALLFAVVQAVRALRLSPGGEDLTGPARALQRGYLACLKWHLPAVALLFLALFGLLCFLAWAGILPDPWLPCAFLTGGLAAALSALAGLLLTHRAAPRAAAALDSPARALSAALTAGEAASFASMGLGLLHLTGWLLFLQFYAGYGAEALGPSLVLYGLGGVVMALLLRAGASLYAQAAALACSAEPDVPDREGLSPGALAQGAGELLTAGASCAHRSALFAAAPLPALALAVPAGAGAGKGWPYLLFPLAVMVVGVVCALLSSLLLKAGDDTGLTALLKLLHRGGLTAAGLTSLVCAPLSYLLTGEWTPWAAVTVGLLAGCLLALCAQRLSAGRSHPLRALADAMDHEGSGGLLDGLSLALRSAAVPLLLLAIALLGAFALFGGYGSADGDALTRGLYGVSLAGAGLSSALGFWLSAALSRPALSNARRLGEASGADRASLHRLEPLVTLGSVASSACESLTLGAVALLLPTLLWIWVARTGSAHLPSPALLLGALGGAVAALLLVSLLLSGARRCVPPMAAELRRQNRESARRSEKSKNKLDPAACTLLGAKGSLWRLLPPCLLALCALPVARLLLGQDGSLGFTLGAAVTALPAAAFLAHAGDAWAAAPTREDTAAARLCRDLGGLLGNAAAPLLELLVLLCLFAALAFPW